MKWKNVPTSVSRIVISASIFFPIARSNTIEFPCADVWQSIPWSRRVRAQLCGQHDFALVPSWRFRQVLFAKPHLLHAFAGHFCALASSASLHPVQTPSLLTSFSQRFQEPNMILFIFKNALTAIPTIHHMVDRPAY